MEVEIKIDKTLKAPKTVIFTNEITEEIHALAAKLSGKVLKNLIGYKDSELILLNLEDIINIYAQGGKVYARTKAETALLKYRLYELENILDDTSFLRISNSEIANFKKVKSLDMSISGILSLKFKDGEKTFVSRRYVEKIKKFLGI